MNVVKRAGLDPMVVKGKGTRVSPSVRSIHSETVSRSTRFKSSRVSPVVVGGATARALMDLLVLSSGNSNYNGPPQDKMTARSTVFWSSRIVAEPVVCGELIGMSLGETRRWAIHPFGGHAEEVCGELGDFFAAFAQRRDFEREHAEPVEHISWMARATNCLYRSEPATNLEPSFLTCPIDASLPLRSLTSRSWPRGADTRVGRDTPCDCCKSCICRPASLTRF